MATCVIECNSDLQKRVGGSNSAISKAAAVASLRPMALPTEGPTKSKPIPINNKPGPSSNSIGSSFNDFRHQHNNRGIKRSANLTSSSWADDDGAASILSMATKFSTSTISDRRKASISSTFSKPIITSSSNDPSDVLLHQLTQVCEKAQKTGAIEPSKSNKLTINTVLESDKNSSTLKTTKLVNHFISCFVVGGEIRLCSPQIYSVIMKDVHEDDVTHWIREYNIVDHMASHEQITSLKLNRAIPPELGSCGLMTKTNAERLVGALIDPNNYRILPADKRDKFDPILVEHDCFGGCEGRLYSVLFPGPCIECIECKCLMTTEAFCRHSHISGLEKSFEPCHWGFDAANWAKYIRLHHLAENNQESVDRFYSFIKAQHLQQHQQQKQGEDTLEDNLEVLVKNSMISAPLSALAVQLLAAQHAQQQQQQQQHHFHGSASTSSGIKNNHGVVSAPSSLPTSSFIPPPPPSTSTLSTTSATGGSAQQHQQSPAISNNTNPLSHLLPLLQLQQSLGSNAPQQQQQALAQLQALLNNNQQPQQPQAASTNPGAILLAAFQQQQQQKQFELTLNTLRNAGALPSHLMDESDIPRKRAHTISEMPSSSSSMAVRPKQDDFSLSSISFGMLQSDQQLMAILSELTENETYRRVTDLINLSIGQRVQPIADDNSRLRKENQKLQEELQAKNDLLARIAAAGIQQQQQQQQQRHFSSTPSSLIPGSSTSHLHQNLHHLQQQQPPQIAEQDSDIEIDEQ